MERGPGIRFNRQTGALLGAYILESIALGLGKKSQRPFSEWLPAPVNPFKVASADDRRGPYSPFIVDSFAAALSRGLISNACLGRLDTNLLRQSGWRG